MFGWLRSCWACRGKGVLRVPGRTVPPEELPEVEQAEQMVLGGQTYEAVEMPCRYCGKGH